MDNVKAVLFDVHGTLVYEDHPITEIELSDYLFSRGYEISPHQVRAAWAYVAFIDHLGTATRVGAAISRESSGDLE